jgi:hypothetical protein
LVVEGSGIFAQYVLDELDGGQELDAVRDMANGLTFIRTW